jgi:hypothetical protein
LAHNEDVALQSLVEYVQEVIDTNIAPQFIQTFESLMANHRAGLSEYESRDNSQYSDETDQSDSIFESDSDDYVSTVTHHDEFNSDNSDNYESAYTHMEGSNSSSESNSDFNTFSNDEELNNESNQFDVMNESSSYIGQNDNNSESNVSYNKNLTDDALDLSDTFHMFFDESSDENKSTIDFILEKQQEEMPDIMDSDGGE